MTDNELTIALEEIEGIDISEDDIRNLERMVDECVEDVDEMTTEFGERIDEHLTRINESAVYEELGLELTVDMNYEFSLDDREE